MTVHWPPPQHEFSAPSGLLERRNADQWGFRRNVPTVNFGSTIGVVIPQIQSALQGHQPGALRPAGSFVFSSPQAMSSCA